LKQLTLCVLCVFSATFAVLFAGIWVTQRTPGTHKERKENNFNKSGEKLISA